MGNEYQSPPPPPVDASQFSAIPSPTPAKKWIIQRQHTVPFKGMHQILWLAPWHASHGLNAMARAMSARTAWEHGCYLHRTRPAAVSLVSPTPLHAPTEAVLRQQVRCTPKAHARRGKEVEPSDLWASVRHA